MPFVYVQGIGGLGNILYQIANAIYYAEKYGYTIALQNKERMFYGTSITHGRNVCMKSENGERIPYRDTIFKHFKWVDEDEKEADRISIKPRHNDLKVDPKGKSLTIKGHCQHLNLFLEILPQIPKYLCLDESWINEYIQKKYGDVSEGIMVGLRVGRDFGSGSRHSADQYIRALQHVSTDKLFIISDKPNAWKNVFRLQSRYPAVDVVENDIIQFYLGIKCKHYIFSESTFHAWIAYIGTTLNPEKKTICFRSDFTNRNLHLKQWTIV
tara:strand:- start:3589 stop:4395 length:807 start_codon:yes stop_codon:yes gene_type:complete